MSCSGCLHPTQLSLGVNEIKVAENSDKELFELASGMCGISNFSVGPERRDGNVCGNC